MYDRCRHHGPVVAGLGDELHGAAGHVRRLGMSSARAPACRRGPAASRSAGRRRAPGRNWPSSPMGSRRRSPARADSRRRRGRGPAAGRMQAVVALVGLEAAFASEHADVEIRDRCPAAASPRRRPSCASCRPATCGCRAGADDPQRRLADAQREAVPVRPVRSHVAAGVEAHPRRAADRRLDIGAGEPHAARRQGVDVRRLEIGWPAQLR